MFRPALVLARQSGVSGMALYCPPSRVDLKNWCQWRGQPFDKVSAVVGQSFRVCTDKENAYTMAASSVLRLILNYDIDPTQVGQLNLGTESSTDNSAGSVIVKGMVDMALNDLGMPRLSRNCDVQEVKHACLGGMYALQNAARYTQLDGDDRVAIAVASDIASYVKDSTGEVTSGAGAVAMLVERKPKLFELDLARSGSASSYRSHDFRKPITRHFTEGYGSYKPGNFRVKDWPVFSGPYSTVVYTDTVCAAFEDLLSKTDIASPADFFAQVQAIWMHRPYAGMPVSALAALYARALARGRSDSQKVQFEKLCDAAKVKPEDVLREIDTVQNVDFFQFTKENPGQNPNFTPSADAVAKALRKDEVFTTLLKEKMSLGNEMSAHLGNLYTASLPAWVAAGFESAVEKYPEVDNDALTGSTGVLVGYGSGDASIATPITPVSGWQEAAKKINVSEVLQAPVLDLSQEEYEGVHGGTITEDLVKEKRKMEFVIEKLGTTNDAAFQDLGVEYYKFIQ